MLNKSLILSALTVISLMACRQEKATVEPTTISESSSSRSVLDFDKLAAKILERADLQEAERVLLMMAPGRFDPLVAALADRIEASGAHYLGALSVTGDQPAAWTTRFITECSGKDAAELKELFKQVEIGIMLPGATPDHQPYAVLQDMLEEGIRRTIHFHWAGAYDTNGQLLDTDDVIDAFYQRVVLNTDYNALTQHQQAFEKAMRDSEIRVTSEDGTNIRFRIGDRPVTKQDGNASARHTNRARNLIDREIELPAGAIRVAPIETSVNGTIVFPDATWSGAMVRGLQVTIQNGRITDMKADEGLEHVEAELTAAGEAGRSFREFALGFNPLMPLQTGASPWIPYYGYGAGIVRLSLGDNTELGGEVGGGYVRWNFFTNTTVSVDGDTWVSNGTLIK